MKYKVCATHDCGQYDKHIESLVRIARYIDSPAVKKVKGHIMFVPVEVHKIDNLVLNELKKLGVTVSEALDCEHVTINESVNLNKHLSSCHQANVYTSRADEGTNFYRCSSCGDPCNVVLNN